ncbi:phage tail protein I [Exiguobacterium sp. SH5S4]|uniref:phage tail protein I n=1 Tax=Exiguobacterium sp. SH5S4 TaxID=2510961 RepID=UPI00103DDC95|nr:phage tail protein I [Exiguobacterium sp. SH5S4]TCI25580.1 phage tail protein I [Exiguobacterium sp. SH5S4]
MIDLRDFSLRDILPRSLTSQPENAALTEAITEMFRFVLEQTDVLDPTNPIPEMLLDIIAKEEHLDYYDDQLSADQKRALIQSSWSVHRKKGTAQAIEDVVSIILDKARIVEWFEYGGDPYHFRIEIDGPLRSERDLPSAFRAVEKNKRKSTRLESIWFRRDDSIYYRVIYKNGRIHIHPVIAVRAGIYMPGTVHQAIVRSKTTSSNGVGQVVMSGSMYSGQKPSRIDVGTSVDNEVTVTAIVESGSSVPPVVKYEPFYEGTGASDDLGTESVIAHGTATLPFAGVTYTQKGE